MGDFCFVSGLHLRNKPELLKLFTFGGQDEVTGRSKTVLGLEKLTGRMRYVSFYPD